MTQLTEEQVQRYSRQLIIPGFGGKGQAKLAASSALVVGSGGLGSPVALYLAAAGIGILGLVDDDAVSLSNLQRQILHRTVDLGQPKVDSGAQAINALNPEVQVVKHQVRLSAANVLELIAPYDVIISAMDNLPSRYVLNDACVALRKPLIEAGVLRLEGLLTTIIPYETPCYRCLFPELPPPAAVPTCAQSGILGPVAGLVGCLQATEALKLLLGLGEALAGRLLIINAMDMSFRTVAVLRNPQCRVCGDAAGEVVIEDLEWADDEDTLCSPSELAGQT